MANSQSPESGQNFNDQELADIMNEIENLESEFAEAQDNDPVSIEEANLIEEEIPEENKDTLIASAIDEEIKEEENAIEDNIENNVVAMAEKQPPRKNASHLSEQNTKSSVEFNVSGDLTLDIKFAVAGNVVLLSINENKGLCIELESGATFNLPLNSLDSSKKAS